MDVCLYYQILDIGILYEKSGGPIGKRWRIGEKKRLKEENLFWQSLLEFISDEEKGIDCSEKLFGSLEKLCNKYQLPNYERVLEKKNELLNSNCVFERVKDEESKIYNLMKCLIKDMKTNLDVYNDKEMVYQILRILHNLPKALHGCNILNENCRSISCNDALTYAQSYMDEEMKEKYAQYLN